MRRCREPIFPWFILERIVQKMLTVAINLIARFEAKTSEIMRGHLQCWLNGFWFSWKNMWHIHLFHQFICGYRYFNLFSLEKGHYDLPLLLNTWSHLPPILQSSNASGFKGKAIKLLMDWTPAYRAPPSEPEFGRKAWWLDQVPYAGASVNNVWGWIL